LVPTLNGDPFFNSGLLAAGSKRAHYKDDDDEDHNNKSANIMRLVLLKKEGLGSQYHKCNGNPNLNVYKTILQLKTRLCDGNCSLLGVFAE